MEKFDVAIIGGGPAGSTTALYLINLGFNVCLIEKKSFPRETLCGEFLSKEVILSLKHLNLFENFLELKPNRINKFKLFNDGNNAVTTEFQFPAYGIKRGTFDNFLLEAVKRKGITVFLPAEVKEITQNNGYYTITADDGQTAHKINCDKVVAAYGKQNILDKKLNRHFTSHKSYLNGVKFHIDESIFNIIEKDTIYIFVSKGIYCGINYVGNNTATICFLENRRFIQNSPYDWINHLVESNNIFKLLFYNGIGETLKETPIYGSGNIYFGKRELVKNGVYFIGDSSAVIAPLAGDGIGMAMQNAKLISEIFKSQRMNGLDNRSTEILYTTEWNRLFRKRLRFATNIQNIVLNNLLRKIGFKLISTFPVLLSNVIKRTRG